MWILVIRKSITPDQVAEVIFESVFDRERPCEHFTSEEAFEFVINDTLLVELATQQSPDPDVESWA